MSRLIADQLRQRVRNRGGDPLVTYYDLARGERTELSATSFSNWVDKTSNLLVDELVLDPGAVVELELARSAPGHWVTLVLELAAWQVGAIVRVGTPASRSAAAAAELLVLGPDWADHDRSRADAVLACSLHPLGLGFTTALPSDVMDFSLEVRGQSDHHSPGPRTGDEPAWVDAEQRLTQLDLVAAAGADRGRRLVTVTDPWSTVRAGLLTPIISDGSAVLVVGHDPERMAEIAASERVDPTG